MSNSNFISSKEIISILESSLKEREDKVLQYIDARAFNLLEKEAVVMRILSHFIIDVHNLDDSSLTKEDIFDMMSEFNEIIDKHNVAELMGFSLRDLSFRYIARHQPKTEFDNLSGDKICEILTEHFNEEVLYKNTMYYHAFVFASNNSRIAVMHPNLNVVFIEILPLSIVCDITNFFKNNAESRKK